MKTSDNGPIWYAAYGSNCLAARFEIYLTGGKAPGASRAERGARDPRPPTESAPCWMPTGVRFLGHSEKWGGGVAFLDHHGEGTAPGRRYLITRAQFDDVAAQESRRTAASLPLSALTIGTVHAVGSGWYDGLLALAPIDGVPVVTFTSPRAPEERQPTAPSAPYLSTVLRGLLEVHDLPVRELVEHVRAAPGVADGWTAEEMLRLVK